jgi:hypothetical protein
MQEGERKQEGLVGQAGLLWLLDKEREEWPHTTNVGLVHETIKQLFLPPGCLWRRILFLCIFYFACEAESMAY